jgi:hypothetical protein
MWSPADPEEDFSGNDDGIVWRGLDKWSAGHRATGGPLTRFPLKPSAYPPATRRPAHSAPRAGFPFLA